MNKEPQVTRGKHVEELLAVVLELLPGLQVPKQRRSDDLDAFEGDAAAKGESEMDSARGDCASPSRWTGPYTKKEGETQDSLQGQRRYWATSVAEPNDRALSPDRFQTALPGILRDRVIDYVDSTPSGDFFHLRHPVLACVAAVIDNMIRALAAQDLGFRRLVEPAAGGCGDEVDT